ncbi:hypothetical protein ACQ4LE_010710 [Meloidogyne hapla]
MKILIFLFLYFHLLDIEAAPRKDPFETRQDWVKNLAKNNASILYIFNAVNKSEGWEKAYIGCNICEKYLFFGEHKHFITHNKWHKVEGIVEQLSKKYNNEEKNFARRKIYELLGTLTLVKHNENARRMLHGLVNILMSKYGTGYDSRYVSSQGHIEHGQGSGGGSAQQPYKPTANPSTVQAQYALLRQLGYQITPEGDLITNIQTPIISHPELSAFNIYGPSSSGQQFYDYQGTEPIEQQSESDSD